MDPDRLLADLFGFPAFRPGQRPAVDAALAGHDALVVMPTGSGKSVCYQLPGLALDGLTLVVSPLVALMRDQFEALRARGHDSVFLLNSSIPQAERDDALAAVRDGRCRLLMVAPERFMSRRFREAASTREVDLFAVDEAHCLSEWGHDFRPDYLRLADARDELGARATMALTATATPRVARDVARRLRLRDPVAVATGFDRPNLTFDAAPVSSQKAKLPVLLRGLADSGHRPAVVYAGTRRRSEEVAWELRDAGVAAAPYHAGLSAGTRDSTQARFMDGEVDVVVATTAFGMGIDKADVRSVWHVALPHSLEAYYQEAGRAGRDGAPARCVLLHTPGDRGAIGALIARSGIGGDDVNDLLRRLAAGAEADGSFVVDLDELGERGRILLGAGERVGALELAPGRGRAAAGRLRLRAIGQNRRGEVERLDKEARRRRWEGLDAMTGYAGGDGCRRVALLRHFGDRSDGAPTGRCCDVHEPPGDLHEDPAATPARTKRTRGAGRADAAPQAEGPLADALREWRRERARHDEVPAYVVFSDATLNAICAGRPATADQLLAVPGIGETKAERYGADVLRIVAEAP